jgi:hypothetical protein
MVERHQGKASRFVSGSLITEYRTYMHMGLSASKIVKGAKNVLSMYRWKGYRDFLTKYLPGMPMFWTAEDLQHLQGTSTHRCHPILPRHLDNLVIFACLMHFTSCSTA